MLMDLVGEDVFFTGLKEFFARYKYGPASTGDFLKVMEKASGRDLKAFSQNWFYSHLLPEVRTSSSVLKKENGYALKVRVEQLRDVFVFPLWVTWEENGQARAEKVMVKDKVQEAEFILPWKPRNIKINPDHAVPGKFD
jgi:aminopeptidase N